MTQPIDTAVTVQQETRRRDLSTYERRVLIEVVVRSTNQVIAGHLVPGVTTRKQGDKYVLEPAKPQRLLVAESLVPEDGKGGLWDLVQSQAEIEAMELARKNHEKHLAKWVASGQKAATYSSSPEAELHRIRDEGVAPILTLKVISRGHAPELTDEQRQSNGVLAQLLALLGVQGAQPQPAAQPVLEAPAAASSGPIEGQPRKAAKPPTSG